MASPSTPTHGKLAAIYRLRPNGFKGNGLNDLTWGTGFAGASSMYYEVVIDGTGTPDTFKWRNTGGGWTTTVSITGAAQTLDNSQTITFAATTGHTTNDQWTIGNFKDEATTESGADAQVTAAAYRILNPNSPPTFTDDGSETVLILDYTRGQATFTGNVGNVDVDGNNGFIVRSGLELQGYLYGWEFAPGLDLAEISRCGQKWKEYIPGQGNAKGSAELYYIGVDSFWDDFLDNADGTQKYHYLELFNYDPDADQTGDHWRAWVTFTGFSVDGADVGNVVKEKIGFEVLGSPSFTANS